MDDAFAFHRLIEADQTRMGIAEQFVIQQKRGTERWRSPSSVGPASAGRRRGDFAERPQDMGTLEKLHPGPTAYALVYAKRQPSESWQHPADLSRPDPIRIAES